MELLAKLPPEVWLDESDRIEIPEGALFPRMRTGGSQFGSYRVASWIETSRNRVRATLLVTIWLFTFI